MESKDNITLMSSARVRRSLKRMAHEINEQNKTDAPMLLLGIDQRGFVVAKKLGKMLSGFLNSTVTVEQLQLDDESLSNPSWDKEGYRTDHVIIIVDDVIFSGQTMFQALTTTAAHLDPAQIHTAALIDRGHRKFPIRAEFCGMELPTKLNEHVSVLVDNETISEVRLIRKEQ